MIAVASTPPGKLRILALHGFRGSGAALRRQLRSLAQTLAAEAEFSFVDAPARADGRVGWWRAVEEHAAQGTPFTRYDGWQTSRDFIAAECARTGPFDGVLGFSQGATFAGLLLALSDGAAAHGSTPRFDFAILIGGFQSADPEHAALYRAHGCQLSSLHVVGRADAVVPPERSLTLAAAFRDPQIVEHAGGHVIPSEPAAEQAVRGFLREMSAQKAARLSATAGTRP